MRPLQLELSGFTAFRDPVVVDFADVDFFALVGPTGSGKSSIVDAICFALYGCIPRYDDERLIAPAISQGLLEARVRLDFEVDGTQYVAVRVARRQGSGASTREARLERGDEILAGNADEVSAAVEKLLGLPFDHFTKCVVLPQGDFARFLHDKPSKRQDLLVRLLNFGIYDAMGRRANEIAAVEQSRAERIKSELEQDLAEATAESLEAAKNRLVSLEELKTLVADAAPQLRETEASLESASKSATAAEAWIELLGTLRPPEQLGALAENLTNASQKVVTAKEGVGLANAAVTAALEDARGLPDRATLELARESHSRREKLAPQVEVATKESHRAENAEDKAATAQREAEDRLKEAGEACEGARRDERAHDLARLLKKDGPCPVCGQIVAKIPRSKPVRHLEDAEKAERAAASQAESVRQAHLQAAKDLAAATKNLEQLTKQLHEVESAVAEQPDVSTINDLLKQLDAAEQRRDLALDAANQANEQLVSAESDLTEASKLMSSFQEAFDAQRDSVAPLGPLIPKRENLEADWNQLAKWAAAQSKTQVKIGEQARTEAAKLEASRNSINADLDDVCRKADVEVIEGRHGDAVLAASIRAQEKVTRIEKAIGTVQTLGKQLKIAETQHELAKALGRHLSSTGFEKWLINEALCRLCEGATSLLQELSDGQYSLAIDDANNFLVVDHRNADATRSAKTLSGGETFLASLALALALSEHLSELAATGSARLDAIFLDEGFGTLDPETLEIVAAAVESLGAQGRMVAVVTHVRELAERVPVRYEVRKGPHSSTIQKVAS